MVWDDLAYALLPRCLPNHGCEGARRLVHRVLQRSLSRQRSLCRQLAELGAPTPDGVYPWPFNVLTVAALVNTYIWFVTYMFISRKALLANYQMHAQTDGYHSRFSKHRITYADALIVCMSWFLFVRALHFVPCISRRAAPYVRTCFSKLLMGKEIMYLFIIASMLLGLSAMHSDELGPDQTSDVIALAGTQSGVVGVVWLFQVAWHNNLLLPILQLRFASGDAINQLETRAYDEHVFGDEDGQLFPGSCPICLGSWEPSDRIKITPCQHAFHEECLASWMTAARTCALCRQDIVEAVKRSRG